MRDTGALLNSLHSVPDISMVEIGFGVDYAIYHHEGRGVPMRRLLPENENEIDVDEIKDLVMEDIIGSID